MVYHFSVGEDTQHDSNSFEKAVAIVLALLQILKNYGWSKLDFGFICILFLFLILLIKPRYKKGYMPKLLGIYIIYNIVVWIVGAVIAGGNIIPFGGVKCFIIFFTFFATIKIDVFLKYYKIVAYICITFLFFQNLTFYLLGIKISGIMEFLPLSLDVEDVDTYYKNIGGDAWRMCSFFSEPAEFAQYLMPLLTLTLFLPEVKKRWIKVLLFITALLLLQSGNAIVIIAVVILCYLCFLILSKPSVSKYFILISFILGIIVVGGYFIKSEMGQFIIERQDETNDDQRIRTSGFLRIYRGYYVYEALSKSEKVFGANNQNMMDRAISRCPISYMFKNNDYYYNTFQNIIIRTGVVGAIIFFMMLVFLYRKATQPGKTILVSMAVLSFIASFYLSYMMLLYLIIATKSKDIKIIL